MKYFFIPGLGMNINEVKLPTNAVGLQNPGFPGAALLGDIFSREYTLEDVARLHLQTILRNAGSEPLIISGMSLGGMILSILASKLRSQLPEDVKFYFYVTSSNSPILPVLDSQTIQCWNRVRPGNQEDFAGILKPFFSDSYLNSQRAGFENYVAYRAAGKNGQSAKDYILQFNSFLKFDGDPYFSSLDGANCTFISGAEDRVMTGDHAERLKLLCPEARHITIPDLGHMVNMERADLIPFTGVL